MTTTARNRPHGRRTSDVRSDRPARDAEPPALTRARFGPGRRWLLTALLAVVGAGVPAFADELQNIDITIKEHRFSPAEIHVPAGKPTVLTIKNEDSTPEEFDSSALKVEKVIAGGRAAKVQLRPLGVGRYPFMGEYHADTAQGVVIAE
jgi:hypothetical protein